ncbi:MAG TPA: hypothetical protein VN540_10810 [Clostridia bacterium]|nr:hypothetical protein [Clostridia bacterium]
MKRKETLFTILFCIVVIATLLVFFLAERTQNKTDADYAAFLFLLLSEAALYAASLLIITRRRSGQRLFLSAGVVFVLAVYWVTTVAYALFAAPFFKEHLKQFYLLELLTLLATGALVAIFTAAAGHFARNEDASPAGERIAALASFIQKLMADARNASYRDALGLLEEELGLADKRASAPEDDALIGAVGSIANALGSESAASVIERAYTLARQRNIATKRRGASY